MQERPDLLPTLRKLVASVWPPTMEYIHHDAICGRHWPALTRRPTALSALLAVVDPAKQGEGLSQAVIRGMGTLARRHGLRALLAPVRPTLKHRYPLTPMAEYVRWRRQDRLPFDPWLRVHVRLGARVLRIASRSMVVEGRVRDWEQWTGMRFPAGGRYVVPGALVPVALDRRRDRGRYVEPNVWMLHPLRSSSARRPRA